MLYIDNINKVTQSRTLEPLYELTQATPQGFTVAPGVEDKMILPGMVMRLAGVNPDTTDTGDGTFVPAAYFTGDSPLVDVADSDETAYGLSAHFGENALGVRNEIKSKSGLIGVWVGAKDSMFNIVAPAFDVEADWAAAAAALASGEAVYLNVDADGFLTFEADADPTQFQLISVIAVPGPNGGGKITVRFA